jgi:hypothetical protein
MNFSKSTPSISTVSSAPRAPTPSKPPPIPTSDEQYIDRQKITRIIPACRLKRLAAGAGEIEDYVNDILLVIEDDMRDAMEYKRSSSVTEIQSHFEVPNMSPKKSQMFVHYYLLTALRQAGYEPHLEVTSPDLATQRTYIHVRWVTREDIELELQMKNFIRAHTITPKLTKSKPAAATRRRRR